MSLIWLLFSSSDSSIKLMNLKNGKHRTRINESLVINTAIFSPDGKTIFTGNAKGHCSF